MTYREILLDLDKITDGFSLEHGAYKVPDKSDVQNAISILNNYYSEVNGKNLDYNNKEVNGTDYLIIFSNPIQLEESMKRVKNEAIEKHDELNPKLWDENNELKPEVRSKIEEIVQKFDDNLKENDVELDVKDVCIIGSNANYNYTADSDVDIHIIADTSVYPDQEDLAMKVYLAYKSLFNNKYDPTLNGIEAEIYVEPDEVKANSNGVYSLNDGWLKEPEQVDIPEISAEHVQELIQPFEDRYNELIDSDSSVSDVDKLIDDIYLQRQSSILKDGEFGDGNICFKEFRNRGYLQNLRDLKVELENKEMSLNDMNEQLLILHGLNEDCEDRLDEKLTKDDLYVGRTFVEPEEGAKLVITGIDDDLVSYELSQNDGEAFHITDYITYVLNNLNEFEYKPLEEECKVKEEYEELGNGVEFKFNDPFTTLDIYLQWEGIIGYTDDIFEFGSIGYDELEEYLDEEGIYGYTSQIYDIINGEAAYCGDMDENDFRDLCNQNFVDPDEAVNEGLIVKEDVDADNREIKRIYDYLAKNKLYPDEVFFDPRNHRLNVEIDHGDWKHEHTKLDHLMWDLGYNKESENMIDDTGEDTYSSIHEYTELDVHESLSEGTAFDDMPGYMTPERIRELNREKEAKAKAEKDAAKAEKKAAAKERAKAERERQKRIDQREKVNNISYDSLADMAGLDEDNNDLTKDELLAVLRSNMSDAEILKLHKKMFEDLNEDKKLYRCDDCGYEVELLDSEYDGKCPHCGEHSGFYEVDESLNEELPLYPAPMFKVIRKNGKSFTVQSGNFDTVDDVKDYYKFDTSIKDVIELKEDFVISDKPGTKYRNKNGIIIQITEPTVDGEVQFDIIENGNVIDRRKVSDLRSLIRIIDANGYEKIDEDCNNDLNESHKDYDLIFDRDTGDRRVEYGINWIQFFTDNHSDAVRWVRQLNAAIAGDYEYGEPSDDPKYYNPEDYPGDIQKFDEGEYNFRRPRDILASIPKVDFIDKDDYINEAKKTGLVSAAKSVLNRLCKKYENASPEEIYNKALEVAGRSEYPFVKDNLTAKKEEAIKFINGYKEATSLDEAVDESDDAGASLADYLGISLEDMDYVGGDTYETPEGDYLVTTEEEARKYAVNEIKNSIDDLGLDAFTPTFKEWILNNAIDEDAIDGIINQEIEYFEEQEDDPETLEYLRGLDTFDKKVSYIKDLYSDSFDIWAKDYIDIDKVADEAISEDGIAHFIAFYDGEEIDLPNNLKAYRLG